MTADDSGSSIAESPHAVDLRPDSKEALRSERRLAVESGRPRELIGQQPRSRRHGVGVGASGMLYQGGDAVSETRSGSDRHQRARDGIGLVDADAAGANRHVDRGEFWRREGSAHTHALKRLCPARPGEIRDESVSSAVSESHCQAGVPAVGRRPARDLRCSDRSGRVDAAARPFERADGGEQLVIGKSASRIHARSNHRGYAVELGEQRGGHATMLSPPTDITTPA